MKVPAHFARRVARACDPKVTPLGSYARSLSYLLFVRPRSLIKRVNNPATQPLTEPGRLWARDWRVNWTAFTNIMTSFLLTGVFQATVDYVDHALFHHPRSQHRVSDVIDCFKKCQGDSQCLSFNFQHESVLPTRRCELNGATKLQDPMNYVGRPGYTYYENGEWMLKSTRRFTFARFIHLVIM